MRILIVNNFYEPNVVGGAERSVRALVEALSLAGHETFVFTLGSGSLGNVVRFRYPLLERIWPVSKNRGFSDRLMFQFVGDLGSHFFRRKFESIIDDISPDLIHTNNLAGMGSSFWSVAHDKGIPIVHTLRDYYQMCAKQNMLSAGEDCKVQCGKCKALTYIRKLNSKYVDVVVGNSKCTLERHLSSGYFENAVADVISGGLSPDFLSPVDRGWRSGSIGFIGQIIPSKGLDDVLALASRVDAKVYIAGEGPAEYVDGLKRAYSHLRNVVWLGYVNSIAFFDMIDVLVVPSRWAEPLPRVIYEAMARGVPCIATRSGGNPEIMKGRLLAYQYDSGDIDALFSLYGMLCDEIRNTRICEEITKEAKMYSAESVASKYVALFEGVVA